MALFSATLPDRIRRIAPDVPIAVALDFHTQMTDAMIRGATVMTGYRTYPHIDMAVTGKRAVELLDATLRASKRGNWDEAARIGWIDCSPDFETSHFLNGFPSSDGKFHFRPDWGAVGPYHDGMKTLPVHRELRGVCHDFLADSRAIRCSCYRE